MKAIVAGFFFLSLIIAVILFIGYLAVKLFCRSYPKSEEYIWGDGNGADYEHETELKSQKSATGYYNFFVPVFFFFRRK